MCERRNWDTPPPVSQAIGGSAKVAQGLEAVRTDVQALRAEATVPEARAGSTRLRPRSTSLRSPTSGRSSTCGPSQRLLASDVVFGDGLERSEAALASLEQARVAEAPGTRSGRQRHSGGVRSLR